MGTIKGTIRPSLKTIHKKDRPPGKAQMARVGTMGTMGTIKNLLFLSPMRAGYPWTTRRK
jgi:hypothetical protein